MQTLVEENLKHRAGNWTSQCDQKKIFSLRKNLQNEPDSVCDDVNLYDKDNDQVQEKVTEINLHPLIQSVCYILYLTVAININFANLYCKSLTFPNDLTKPLA